MSLNIKMEKKIRVKNQLKNKLVKEGLTKNEKQLLNRLIKEAPIDYDGPERMEPGIEKKITDRETPYAEHPALPTGDRDFVELVSSKRFIPLDANSANSFSSSSNLALTTLAN